MDKLSVVDGVNMTTLREGNVVGLECDGDYTRTPNYLILGVMIGENARNIPEISSSRISCWFEAELYLEQPSLFSSL
ncbi:hypothetical protein J6590_010257 [Homalodisca vitripennis]|nr:hypothetical protein J6590_010257 [Homalodisca vitripennis]